MCLDFVEAFRRDRAQALQLYQDGCARGERVACRQLAFRTFKGDGVPKDLTRAFALFDRACKLDDQISCAQEGVRLERGEGTARDLERAKVLYRRACKRGIRPIPCESLRRLGEVPPPTAVTSADAAESVHSTASLEYDLRIPANWEFVSPDTVELSDAPTATERVAARPRGAPQTADSLLLAVGDRVAIIPGKFRDREPGALDEVARAETAWLAAHQLLPDAVRRTRFLGYDAVRLEARVAGALPRHLTIIVFLKDRRRFELRCISEVRPPDMPCADAFGALEIHEPRREEPEQQRVLHLRDDRRGFSFDAPDDAWLAVGPRDGLGGRQQVWIWANGGRQIDVGVLEMPLEQVPATADVIATAMAGHYRSQGAVVAIKSSTLGEQPCQHLAVDGKQGAQDLFIQSRGRFVYSILVTAPERDPKLLDRARAGIHFTWQTSPP